MAFSATGTISFRALTQLSMPVLSSMPRRLPEKQITFRQPSFDVASMAALMALSEASQYFGSAQPIVQGVRAGHRADQAVLLDASRKSAGPSRSIPTRPIRFAATHRSSSEILP